MRWSAFASGHRRFFAFRHHRPSSLRSSSCWVELSALPASRRWTRLSHDTSTPLPTTLMVGLGGIPGFPDPHLPAMFRVGICVPMPSPFCPQRWTPTKPTPKVHWQNEEHSHDYSSDAHFPTCVPSASCYSPSAPFHTTHDVQMDSLSRTLSDALMINRLPMQEPCVFVGDPLQYPIWRSSFAFLIERQNIASNEKMLLSATVSRWTSEGGRGRFFPVERW